jgi:hypothetical protein
MPRLNWKIILYNIAEAREELERIEALAKSGKKPAEGELQLMLEHAYHHLNFAWNVRRVSSKRYAHLSDEEFNQWSKFPKEIEEYKVEIKRKRAAKK